MYPSFIFIYLSHVWMLCIDTVHKMLLFYFYFGTDFYIVLQELLRIILYEYDFKDKQKYIMKVMIRSLPLAIVNGHKT